LRPVIVVVAAVIVVVVALNNGILRLVHCRCDLGYSLLLKELRFWFALPAIKAAVTTTAREIGLWVVWAVMGYIVVVILDDVTLDAERGIVSVVVTVAVFV
jgi:hypothetical protein